jgi:hypothetical protein
MLVSIPLVPIHNNRLTACCLGPRYSLWSKSRDTGLGCSATRCRTRGLRRPRAPPLDLGDSGMRSHALRLVAHRRPPDRAAESADRGLRYVCSGGRAPGNPRCGSSRPEPARGGWATRCEPVPARGVYGSGWTAERESAGFAPGRRGTASAFRPGTG